MDPGYLSFLGNALSGYQAGRQQMFQNNQTLAQQQLQQQQQDQLDQYRQAALAEQMRASMANEGLQGQGLSNQFTLGLGNLGVSQQNANTQMMGTAGQLALGGQRNLIDAAGVIPGLFSALGNTGGLSPQDRASVANGTLQSIGLGNVAVPQISLNPVSTAQIAATNAGTLGSLAATGQNFVGAPPAAAASFTSQANNITGSVGLPPMPNTGVIPPSPATRLTQTQTQVEAQQPGIQKLGITTQAQTAANALAETTHFNNAQVALQALQIRNAPMMSLMGTISSANDQYAKSTQEQLAQAAKDNSGQLQALLTQRQQIQAQMGELTKSIATNVVVANNPAMLSNVQASLKDYARQLDAIEGKITTVVGKQTVLQDQWGSRMKGIISPQAVMQMLQKARGAMVPGAQSAPAPAAPGAGLFNPYGLPGMGG